MIRIDGRGAVTPNPGGQSEFMADWKHRMVGLAGGWSSGKTWAGTRKLLTLHLHNAFTSAGDATFVPSALIGVTYPNIRDTSLPSLLAAIDESGLDYTYKGSGSIAGGRYSGPAIVFPELGTQSNPSLILIRSADRPDLLTGWEVGAAMGDEASRWPEDRLEPKRDPLLQLSGRLRHPRARFIQAMYTFTHEGDHTRIYEEFSRPLHDRRCYVAATRENPLAAEFYESQLHALSPEMAEQYLDGRVVSRRGAGVYSCFDAKIHVSQAVRLRDDLPLDVSFDFNIAPGMHVIIGQHDANTDTFSAIHEIHAKDMNLLQALRAMEEWVQRGGGFRWPLLRVFGDASGSARSIASGRSNYDLILGRMEDLHWPYQVKVPRANPAVIDRINALQAVMLDAVGRSRWCVHPACVRLIEDLRRLRYSRSGDIDKSDKTLGHASDAESYRVHYLRPLRSTRSQRDDGGRFGV